MNEWKLPVKIEHFIATNPLGVNSPGVSRWNILDIEGNIVASQDNGIDIDVLERMIDCLHACNGMDIPFNVITRTRQRLAIVVNKLKYIGSINHGLDSDAMHKAIDELLEEQKKFDEDWPRG